MKKKLKISYNAPVVLTFVLLCFLVTLIGLLTGSRSTTLLFSAYRGSVTNPLTYLRLFTHVLGHSGLDHFIGNGMYLLLLGPLLEEKYGSATMLKVILATALVTGVVHCVLWSNTALCGASGVVFAFIVLSSFTAFKEGEIPLSFLLVAILYVGQEVSSGLLIADNVSNLTHIIGGVVGASAGYMLNRK
ncbi:MAG: rhomboid family intramembrane serine protease [Faecalibacterium sp.]|nr:rhomboid family intramembrane serine protease [Faecalibacterium sp.]